MNGGANGTGKALRKDVPRSSHGTFEPHPQRPSIVEFMDRAAQGRLADLIPVRHYRMSLSPFAFFRGAADIMAYDLAQSSAVTGIHVQACGDAHLQNFGIFATAERNVIFDINDFDETLPAPWEWDVKRLAASVFIAGCDSQLPERRCTEAVLAAVGAYRVHMRRCAEMTALDVWYARIDASAISDLHQITAPTRTHALVADDYTGPGNENRIADKPPKLFHPDNPAETMADVRTATQEYRASLRDDLKVLLDRYTVVDYAVKVVGVGSVGTRCAIALLVANDRDRLILQVKEARASVLERFVAPSTYAHHGERVVAGQRLMQTASDIFLGWTSTSDGHQYYVRQASDLKISIDVTKLDAAALVRYAASCGEALALAHARSGDPQQLAAYMGSASTFDEAIAAFAARYADQNEADYTAFMEALRADRLLAREG